MRFSPEIKEFTKNTLIFTLFFTLLIQLGWDHIAPYMKSGVAASNEVNFRQSDMTYMGNVATAISLNIGQKTKSRLNTPVELTNEAISIAEILASPKAGEMKLIAGNMLAMQSYLNLLRTDILSLLDQSDDRAMALDEHIDLLKYYYTSTNEKTLLLAEQSRDLIAILATSTTEVENAKAIMEEKYRAFEYESVDTVIDSYVEAKNAENRARVYLAYVERFQRGYSILQSQNKIILDTIINNREALIKRSVVVIPDSGTELLKKLNLLVTEEEYKNTSSGK